MKEKVELDVSKLELIEAFETMSLYYDREGSVIWIFDGKRYWGADMNVLADFLINGIIKA